MVKWWVFIRAQASSLISSATDFLVTVLMVEVFKLPPVAAGAIGTTTGGVLNFTLGRNWVFKSKEHSVPVQAFRYLLVWVGNLVLNVGGLALMVHVFKVNYVFSKILVSLLVGVFYNYVLQGKYVFKK